MKPAYKTNITFWVRRKMESNKIKLMKNYSNNIGILGHWFNASWLSTYLF